MKCIEHAKMMEALFGPVDKFGPNAKAIHDKLNVDDECIATESQVVFLITEAIRKDEEGA